MLQLLVKLGHGWENREIEGLSIIILVDTREQKPLPFKVEGYITEIRKVKLDIGDYGCQYQDGSIAPLAFERKGLSDLFGTLGKGHSRFKKEIARSKASNVTLVMLIEGTLSDVYKGIEQSEVKGESVVKKLFTLWLKYDIYHVFMKSREEMVEYIREAFEAIGRLEKQHHANSVSSWSLQSSNPDK